MKRKYSIVSLMLGAVLLAGCSAQSRTEASGSAGTEKAAAVTAENTITLSGSSASSGSENVSVDGGVITITGAGTYELRGTLSDGMIIVSAGDEDDVNLVLNGADITSSASAAIYVASCGDATVTLADGSENSLSNGGTFTAVDESNIDAVIFSKEDLTLTGSGSLTIDSPAGHGVVSKDDLTVESGSYLVTAASHGMTGKDELLISGGDVTITAGKDGLHAKNDEDDSLGNLTVSGGSVTVTAADDGLHASGDTVISAGTVTVTDSSEGIEGETITISGGAITVTAKDDGLNAAGGSDQSGAQSFFGGNPFEVDENAAITISGGTLYVNADGDGIDSNGSITMTGGQVFVSGPTNSGNGALDYGTAASITGGTIVAAGASGMAENFSSAENQGVMLVSTGAQSAGTAVTLTDESGAELVSWTPEKAYECVVISTPDVQQGGTYTLTAGSSSQTVTMTSAVYGGGMGMGQMGGMGGRGQMPQDGQMNGQMPQNGQMGGVPQGGGMRRP